MNTKLTIKNFRVFDENGASFDVKPITILTGCNSSGKSSMAKAVFLLNSFLSQVKKSQDNKEKIDPSKYSLDFSTNPNNLLGNFNKVVHNGSSTQKIIFEYTTFSRMLSKEITVQLVFSTDKNDDLHNGWLEKITMSTEDGVFFSSDKENDNICNINIIKDAGFDFISAEFLAHCYCNLLIEYEVDEITKDKFEEQKSFLESQFSNFGDLYMKNVAAYMRTTINKESIINRCNIKSDIISWSKENGSLFNIPIIDDLNKLSKTEIKSWIKKKVQKSLSKNEKYYSNLIIDDYVSSDSSSFFEYFKKYEYAYLEAYYLKTPFSLKPKSSFLEVYEDFAFFSIDSCRENKCKDISFDLLYEIVMIWNEKLYDKSNEYYNRMSQFDGLAYKRYHYMLNNLMTTFAADVIMDALTPDWSGNMEYISSSRAKINRLYSLNNDDDFTSLLKNYFESKMRFQNSRRSDGYTPNEFINKWIKKFGIGYGIILTTDDDGRGVTIHLQKTSDDKNYRLLADEGYGITQLVSILLQIETAILSAKGEKVNNFYGLDDLDGYSSSKFNYEINTLLIEEPEIHLHPKYQSLLADMLFDAYQNYNIHFIVETHSEYLIRRLQLLTVGIETESKLNKDDVSIFYVYSREEAQKEGLPLVKRISICEDGYLDDTFGSGFFDEATNLSLKLM